MTKSPSVQREHALFLGSMFIYILASQATMLADAAVGGNLLGADVVSAVDLVMPIYELYYALIMLLGMGACTVASLRFGEGDIPAVRRHFTGAIVSSLVAMLLVGIVILVFKTTVLDLLCGQSPLRNLTEKYLIAMLPFFTIGGVLIITMIFTAMAGHPLLVMCCAIVQFAVNISGNLLLIKTTELGIEALAYSSLLSSIVGLLVVLPNYLHSDCPFRMIRCSIRPLVNAIKENIHYGSGFVAVSLSYMFMTFAMNTLILRYMGEQALFYWSIVLMIYITGDYASAAASETCISLGGRYDGANRKDDALLVYNRSLIFTLVWIVLLLAMVLTLPKLFLPLFGAADMALYPELIHAILIASPFILGISIGNLYLVRLIPKGFILRYTLLASSLYLSIPLLFLLFCLLSS